MQLEAKPTMADGTAYRSTAEIFDVNFDHDSDGYASRAEAQLFFAKVCAGSWAVHLYIYVLVAAWRRTLSLHIPIYTPPMHTAERAPQ